MAFWSSNDANVNGNDVQRAYAGNTFVAHQLCLEGTQLSLRIRRNECVSGAYDQVVAAKADS
eukprot:2620578-Amphidinium_carterae.2